MDVKRYNDFVCKLDNCLLPLCLSAHILLLR